MSENRRSTPRSEAFRVGKLSPDDTAGEIECLVWDVSAVGAQVEVGSAVSVPDRFTLRIGAYAPPLACAVVRRDGRVLGVRFGA